MAASLEPTRARIRIGEVLGGALDGVHAVVVTIHERASGEAVGDPGGVVNALTFTAAAARQFAAGLERAAAELERREAPGGGAV